MKGNMESSPAPKSLIHRFNFPSSPLKIFVIMVAVALLGGVGTGYILASTSGNSGGVPLVKDAPKSAEQDTRTFRDFAEGTIQKKAAPKEGEYSEGTHMLIRQNAVPVALTSSVVDLAEFEGKKVKVYGETQKAIKEGWLMDVGKVEVQ
jgi:hypothetical protein